MERPQEPLFAEAWRRGHVRTRMKKTMDRNKLEVSGCNGLFSHKDIRISTTGQSTQYAGVDDKMIPLRNGLDLRVQSWFPARLAAC